MFPPHPEDTARGAGPYELSLEPVQAALHELVVEHERRYWPLDVNSPDGTSTMGRAGSRCILRG